MRKLFDKYKKQLEEFIEQREDLIFLARCTEDDYGFVLQLLGEIEQVNASDLFLLFSDPFTQPGPFVSTIAQRIRDQYKTACDWAKEQGKPVTLAPPPDSLSDEGRPPAQRMIEAITYAKSLLPADGGNRLVWALFPMQVADWTAYLELIAQLAPWKGIEPWMRSARLLFRFPKEPQRQPPRIAKAPRTRTVDVSVAPADFEANLESQVEDESLPMDQRMNALVSLAVIDYGYNRVDLATTRYTHALGYYQSTNNHVMIAMVLNGLGDVARRQGDLAKAKEHYECAIPPAGEAKHGVVLASIVRNLGDVAYMEKKFPEAEKYYDQLDQLTTATLDAECKARALEWKGLSQEQQKMYDKALETWQTDVEFIRKIGMPHAEQDVLQHMARVYKQLGKQDKVRETEKALEAARAELRTLQQGGAA
jgi:tetratricopeptide (TPR) repeat protein